MKNTDTLAVTSLENYLYDPATGNLLTKGATTQAGGQTFGATSYTYDPSHAHAAKTLSNGNSYTYDANGNQRVRTINGETFNLSYDAENRLVEVKKGTDVIATFVYDGDGRQVKSTVSGVTTTFVGAHYQIVNGTVTKYYFAGASRIAMKTGSTLTYLLGDHLGSTSLTTDDLGNFVSELRYKPWGETRYSSGTTATSYRYTGQREEVSFGLYFYNARWYDSALGRFAQADTIVPGGVQGYDRYAYVNNSPVNYVDPSGHEPKYGCYSSTNGTCTNANGTPLSTGNGKGGRKEKEEEEGVGGTVPDLGLLIETPSNQEVCSFVLSGSGSEYMCSADYSGLFDPSNPYSLPALIDSVPNIGYDPSQIDMIEMGIDIVGIATDGGTFIFPAATKELQGIGLAADVAGAEYQLYKATSGKLHLGDLTFDIALKIAEEHPMTAIRAGRAVPYVGIIFNSISIVSNLHSGFYTYYP